MTIDSAKLTHFRNYSGAKMVFHPRLNALVGHNGAGKTNVLDALYYLCLGKSYFSSGDRMVIQQGTDFFRLEGVFTADDASDIVIVKSKPGNRKEIEISGKKVEKISDHVGRFLCVIIAPDDIHLMMEGSEERRNFLNNTIVQTDRSYLDDLITYTHLLKQRNALLKAFADKKYFDSLLLESMTVAMYDPAMRIFESRDKQVRQMSPVVAETYGEISEHRESCSIEYSSQLANGNLRLLMAEHVEKDRLLARTTQGIHKDDLLFLMNGEPLKNFASQGQLKSFVLSLKLTQYKIMEINSGKKPVLLLDDIFDKLDQSRVRHLLRMLIKQNFGQVFITDTNADRIKNIIDELDSSYSIFYVDNGQIDIRAME
ncbi:MAG: DNA replication and repair protein RecF [Saprospiraceae bacterium]|nr:DNA replication and repair protein RecF [Saprospiraceae bacterium]